MDIKKIMKTDYLSYKKLKYTYNVSDEQMNEFYKDYGTSSMGNYNFVYNFKILENEIFKFNDLLNIYNFEFNEVDNIIGEIQGSLSIEGVYSSRKLINQIMKKENPSDKDLNTFNMNKAYQYILNDKEINKENLRELYGILVNDVEMEGETLDGDFYRKDDVGIYSGTNKKIASGINSNELDQMMELLISMNMYEKLEDTNEYVWSFVAHYLFVFIHPYYDRNGRMARLFQTWMLKNRGNDKILPISELIKYDKKNYYDAIQNVRESYNNDLNYFLLYMFKASNQMMESKIKISKYRDLLINDDIILTENEEQYLNILLINFSEEQFDWKKFIKLLKYIDDEKSKSGALKILNALESKKVLSSKIKNKTKIYYIIEELKNIKY